VAIQSAGMTPPDSSFLKQRIDALQIAGLISARIASRLINRNDAENPSRARKTYFIFTRDPLTSESGVGGLLKFWGGEALYSLHDSDLETGPVLGSLGVPRIIEAFLPVSAIGGGGSLDVTMVQQFLAARGLNTFDRDFAARTERPIPAASIRRVISRSDADFERLTNCSSWQEPLL
jgi:hypothetical protein